VGKHTIAHIFVRSLSRCFLVAHSLSRSVFSLIRPACRSLVAQGPLASERGAPRKKVPKEGLALFYTVYIYIYSLPWYLRAGTINASRPVV
jgi:hypothetical protein